MFDASRILSFTFETFLITVAVWLVLHLFYNRSKINLR